MIITKEVKIKANSSNISYLRDKGYKMIYGEECLVKPIDLKKSSNVLIKVECDVCKAELEMSYKLYNRNLEKGGFITCKKCKHVKIKKTSLEKYGNSTYNNSKKAKETELNSRINNYEKDIPGFLHYYRNTKIVEILCMSCNKSYRVPTYFYFQRKRFGHDTCINCNPPYSKCTYFFESEGEKELRKTIPDNVETIYNDRSLIGKELDIYLPEYKLGIEFNGVYWHSEAHKDKDYHLEKTKACNDRGVKLIHIWEDQWKYKRNIVKSRIRNELGQSDVKIFGRKTVINTVDSKASNLFLENNHIQGKVNGKYKYGLYYNDELVALMTFGKLRKNLGQTSKDKNFELLRFCNKLNTNVVGGASKLFKHFVKEIEPSRVLSYANRDWTNFESGSLYDNLGFKYIGETIPNYYWIEDGIRKNRFNFRKDILVKEGYDSTKTEVEIMHDRKYLRCYDTGNLKFEFINI